MDTDTEQYILLILSDGNLPTGSFVASSGLESYVKHGFFASPSSTSHDGTKKTIDFIRYSMESYSHSALPFVLDAHAVTSGNFGEEITDQRFEGCLRKLTQLDALYDSMTLNHVSRRASKAQGVALLTLFSKGFSRPKWLDPAEGDKTNSPSVDELVDRLKLEIRRGNTSGHLPICWGVLTAALGLSAERSQYLHLFLHARGLLSAAIRMNVLGPYAAQQLLLHAVRPLVESDIARCGSIHTGIPLTVLDGEAPVPDLEVTLDGPANTWPLGEILAARHDLQHSRIFNS